MKTLAIAGALVGLFLFAWWLLWWMSRPRGVWLTVDEARRVEGELVAIVSGLEISGRLPGRRQRLEAVIEKLRRADG